MLEWLDRFGETLARRRGRELVVLFLIAVIAIVVGGTQVLTSWISANAAKQQATLASSTSLFLDCVPDDRISKTSGQLGLLPKRVIFLDRENVLDLMMGTFPQLDADLNIIEIHNTFKRCTLTNTGSVGLDNIQVDFVARGYAFEPDPGWIYNPNPTQISKYLFKVTVAHLGPNDRTTFGITNRVMEAFYVNAGDSSAETSEATRRPITLAKSDATRAMGSTLLAPSMPRKTPWKPSTCMFQGSGVLHNGKLELHLPKACQGAIWIMPPASL